MGDISIIARRLKDGHVQYGWSGNGGYYKTVGLAIEKWYTTPEMVEYLFGLGQLRLLVPRPSLTTPFRAPRISRAVSISLAEKVVLSETKYRNVRA